MLVTVREMRSAPMRQTDVCLLCEDAFAVCMCSELKCPSVEISKCITVKSGTGFFFYDTHLLFKVVHHSQVWHTFLA